PFHDGDGTSFDIRLVNLTNGKGITFSGLLPSMIEKYGFYEGQGTSYRLPPREILEVLDFLKKQTNEVIAPETQRQNKVGEASKILCEIMANIRLLEKEEGLAENLKSFGGKIAELRTMISHLEIDDYKKVMEKLNQTWFLNSYFTDPRRAE